MGRGRGTTSAGADAGRRGTGGAAATSRPPGSPLVRDRRVSRAELAGRHGMHTGVFFHVTPTDVAQTLRTEGIHMSGDIEDSACARWTDPDAVYVWPTEAAATDWTAFRRDGFYGGRASSRYETVAINARPDEVTVCPDNEDFGAFVGAWAGERHSGEPWPTEEETDAAPFLSELRTVAGPDGVTLQQWMDTAGEDIYWDVDEDEDDTDEMDERVIASRLVRAMPAGLRAAVCERYAEHGRALMLLSAVPPGRVAELVD